MQVNPYLNFNGDCAAAFKFYEHLFGGKITFMMTWGDSPIADQFPNELHSKIMHATLVIGDASLMGADVPPDLYKKPTGVDVSIHLKDIAEGERIFNALSENGNIHMPFEQTFWAARFGACIDRFGIPWMINCEVPPAGN